MTAPKPSFADEITAITDPVRLQQLQVIWTHQVHQKVSSIARWVTLYGTLTVLGLVVWIALLVRGVL